MVEELWLEQSDGVKIFLQKWTSDNQAPLAVFQLAHGMAEHSGRYHDFANFLVANGYAVYANDHRGHGQTGDRMGVMGFFAEKDGFERAVYDLKFINDFIHQEHPGLPVFILGHSMGSFLVRRLIQRYENIVDGVILSGTASGQGVIGKIGRMIAKAEAKLRGPQAESRLMNMLVFGSYQKKVRGEGHWISSDPETVEAYNNDPYCGFISTAKFFDDLLYGLDIIHKVSEIERTDQSLPILFISGVDDPVGDFGKGVNRAVQGYKDANIKSIDVRLYEDKRHEMLFEVNRDQVMHDILNWTRKQTQLL